MSPLATVPAVPLVGFLDALVQFLGPSTLTEVVVNGLAKAAIFVMIAGGLTLIFGLMGVLNFAHGSLTMFGAYAGGLLLVLAVSEATGPVARVAYFFVAVVVVFGLLAALGGALEVGLIRPLYDRPPIYQILLTFGLTLVLDELARIAVGFYGVQPISDWQEALGTKPGVLSSSFDLAAIDVVGVSALQLFGGGLLAVAVAGAFARSDRLERLRDGAREHLRRAAPDGFEWQVAPLTVATAIGAVLAFLAGVAVVGLADLSDVSVDGLALFQIAFGVATVAVVWGFLTRTRYGLVVRAGSEDAEMTEALGIDVRRVFTTVFAMGAGIAGVAGLLLAWDATWGASVPLASETLLPAFVVVIIGGLGTFRGTVYAALLVGLVDATMTWWFVNVVDFSGLPEMTVFLILVLVLVLKPQGLFGVAEVGGH